MHMILQCSRQYFNSLPHAEVDRNEAHRQGAEIVFQLTTSRRGRRLKFGLLSQKVKFQLTTSRRGRQHHSESLVSGWKFQLTTSRRGRRRGALYLKRHRVIFQLTTSRRGRHYGQLGRAQQSNFNSLPHAEVDWRTSTAQSITEVFQLTTSRRGRPDEQIRPLTDKVFQLTTSRRGRPLQKYNSLTHHISTHYLTQRQTS